MNHGRNIKIRKLLSLLISISVFGMFAAGCNVFPKEEEALAPPLIEEEKITYNTVTVKKGSVERSIKGTGNLIPAEQKELFFKYKGGRLKGLYVKSGDAVKAGDLLAELDTEDLGYRIEQQKVTLLNAETNLKQLKESGKLDIEAVKIQLSTAKEKYDKAVYNNNPAINDEKKELLNQVRLQEIALKKLYNDYGKDNSEGFIVAQASAKVQEKRIKLNSLLDEYEKSRLTAPVSGKVVFVDEVNDGDIISAYQTIVTVADPSKLVIQYIDEKSSYFTPGSKVEFSLNNKVYTGEVVETPLDIPKSSSAADRKEGGKKYVKIKPESLPPGIKIGDSAAIKYVLEKRVDVVFIPNRLIKSFSGRKYVLVLKDGLKSERDLEVGVISDTDAEIIRGLTEGEMLIDG